MTAVSIAKRVGQILIGAFALIGFIFTLVWLAMHFGIFDVRGSIESRNEFFTSAAVLGALPCSSAVCPLEGTEEWQTVREGLRKDSGIITRVAAETGVPARIIASVVVPEQMRFFTSEREIYKQVFEPLKILGSLSQFSLGVSGIKEETALQIEDRAPARLAPLFSYQPGVSRQTELYTRLTDDQNHYYAYLYTALYIHEINEQWESAGFPIANRPGIIATLFNIGFGNSRPNATPTVGGASVTVDGSEYSYGEVARRFYDSPDLADVFPK